MWPLLSGQNKTAPRTELMLGIMSGGSLIVENLKYIEGVQGPDWWYGPHSPNCTSDTGTHPFNCGDGCLFDLDKDWTEHVNLKASQPADFKRLKARFDELKESVGGGPDTSTSVEGGMEAMEFANPAKAKACAQMWANGGFWGPLVNTSSIAQ
jgi:hypothetical protein